MSVLQILNELSAESGKLAKIAILERNKSNMDLQRVFKAAYDPSINFWLKKIPSYELKKHMISLDEGLNDLQYLADRTYTGQMGIDHLVSILESLSPDDATVITRVIQRDLKVGCSESTANKVWKNLIPEFSYMRCSLTKHVNLEKWNWKAGIYSQEKADAMFANVDVYGDGEVVVTSRAGSMFPQAELSSLISDVKMFLPRNTRTHGELMVVNALGVPYAREISNGMMNKILKGGKLENPRDSVRCVVWDQIPLHNALQGIDYKVGYDLRFNTLSSQVSNDGTIRLIHTKIVHSYREAVEHYQEMIRAGKEGTVIKTRELPWKDGTSKEQIKMKMFADVDLRIIGFNPGNGKNEELFGSLQCETEDHLLEVGATGMSDELRAELWNNRAKVLGKIATVKANSIMKPTGNNTKYSLFLPNLVEIRDDKKIADTLQQVIDQFESLMKGHDERNEQNIPDSSEIS